MLDPALLADPEPPAQPEAGPAPSLQLLAGADLLAGFVGRVEPFAVVERRIIEAAISAFDGNIALAAAALDLSPSTLYRKKLAWQDTRRLS